MPAKSERQRRFMGAVKACQETGKCASPRIRKVAKTISKKAATEFARRRKPRR